MSSRASEPEGAAPQATEFRTIVVAVDGSEESMKAASLAEALASRFQGEMVVLHVRETSYAGASEWQPDWTPELETFIGDLVGRLNRDQVRARSEIRDAPTGHAGETIAKAASEIGADLIVVGSKGRSRVAGFVLGSVAGKVVHSAACPVLIAR